MALLVPTILFLFVLALVLRVDVYFTIVWFLFGAYVLSRLWTQRSIQHLRVWRRFLDRAYIGDEVQVQLTLRNDSRLPIPWLEIGESIPVDLRSVSFPDQVMSVGSKSRHHFEYTLQCRRRGLYEIGPLRLHTGDVLGIGDRLLTVPEPRRLTVYPRVVPLQRLGLPTRSALVAVPSRMPLFEDTSRIMGVRDYSPGDSPRRIHWTASARTGILMVKQYQPSIARETLICLDLDLRDYALRDRTDAIEQSIVVAASLSSHMIVREGLAAGLAVEALDPLTDERRRIVLQPRSEKAHLMSVLEILARIQPATGVRDFVDVLREESVHLAWGSTIVIITGTVQQQMVPTLAYLKRSGHAVGLILVQPPYLHSSHGTLAGVTVHRVWTDRDVAVVSVDGNRT